MKTQYKTLFSFSLIMLLILFTFGCVKKDTTPTISLINYEDKNQEKQSESNEKVLRVAISSITSAKQSIEDYDELLKYIEKHLNVKVEIVQRSTYTEVNEAMKAGRVDLAFVCTAAYVKGHKDFGMELLAAPQVRGEKTYESYIIVSKDSNINSFTDLKGKKFAFTDTLSTTGRMYPLYILQSLGQTPGSFFKEYIYTYSHDNSVKAVYEGLVDGAAVDSLVYQFILERNPKFSSQLKVIDQSPKYATPPVVVRPELDPKLKEQLQNLFINMHKDEKGRAILSNIFIDEFTLQNDNAYDSVRELLNVVKS